MRFIWGSIFGILILALSLTVVFRNLNRSGFFTVSKIEIEIRNSDLHKEFYSSLIQELEAAVVHFAGVPMWQVNLKELSQKLESYTWIEHVELSRRWPNGVSAFLTTKDIPLLMVTGSGKIKPIVEDGTFLPEVELARAPNVPLLRGREFEKRKDLREKAVRVIREIPSKGAFSREKISELMFVEKQGYWARMIQDGIRVRLGDNQIAMKSARLAQVIDYMNAHEFKARVIDADLSKKVLVRLRKDP